MNPMNEVQISKATVSIGVGEAGEKLSRAITLLEQMFDQLQLKHFLKLPTLNLVLENVNQSHVN